MPLRRLVPAAALAALLTASCSTGSGPAAAPLTTTTTVAEGVVAEPVIAPLTGLTDPDGQTEQRPAVAVKLDNAPKARPQAGLEVADVVFEEVVEGGATRFIAVFHSAVPAEAGPVRSVRPMDAKIVSAFGGLMAYSGGIPEFVALMRRAPVQDVNFDVATGAYRQDRSRPRPHHLMVSPEQLLGMARPEHAAPPPAMFDYRPAGAPFGEGEAASVRIAYSQRAVAGYTWDVASGTWPRAQDGVAHVAASGTRIAPANLVVQFVALTRLKQVDQSGSAVTESIVVGEGDAWVFSDGRVTKGRWSKPDDRAQTRYTDAAGRPVRLAPGRTWVHYVPVGSSVSIG